MLYNLFSTSSQVDNMGIGSDDDKFDIYGWVESYLSNHIYVCTNDSLVDKENAKKGAYIPGNQCNYWE